MDMRENVIKAVDYIEENLSGKIKAEQISKIIGYSESYRVNQFFDVYVGMTWKDYTRHRKMSLAADDLKNGATVLDTSLNYGYESPTSFNKAFQDVHGIAPSKAKSSSVQLESFPRFSFNEIEKGAVNMVFYRIEELDSFNLVGFDDFTNYRYINEINDYTEEVFKKAEQMWLKANKGEMAKKLLPIIGDDFYDLPKGIIFLNRYRTPKEREDALEVDKFSEEDKWLFMVGSPTVDDIPDDCTEFPVCEATWAVFSGKGKFPKVAQELKRQIITEWLPDSGYELSDYPGDMDVLLAPYDMENAKFEVWFPVIKT